MATTTAGARLTEGHRVAQLGILATFIESFTEDWLPDAPFSGAAFVSWLSLIAPEVQAAYALSAQTAERYYRAFRDAERVPGQSPGVMVDIPDAPGLVAAMSRYGPDMADRLLASGLSEDAASSRILTALGLQLTKHVLAGGRDTLDAAMTVDGRALGYQRVASGSCCAFCAMVASRGPIYGSRDRAGDGKQWHPGCKCSVEPVFSRATNMPKNSEKYARVWAEVGTGNLNDFRRRLERPALYKAKEARAAQDAESA